METHLTVEPVYEGYHGLTGFRVFGSENDDFNGNYYLEPGDSDGVPYYRKCTPTGDACSQVIRRRNGYWFIGADEVHGLDDWKFSNEGCGVRFDKPPETGWFPIIEYDSDESLELTDDEDEEEYENGELSEDSEAVELPEDAEVEELREKIKEEVKVLGEKVFDIKDQLKEGDYLEMMNLLQRVINKVNS